MNVLDATGDQHRERLDLVETGVGAVEDSAVSIVTHVSDCTLAQLGKAIGETRRIGHAM